MRQMQQEVPVSKRRLQQSAAPPFGISVTYAAEEGYKSQDGQDKWVNENVFQSKIRGVFVDIGCAQFRRPSLTSHYDVAICLNDF